MRKVKVTVTLQVTDDLPVADIERIVLRGLWPAANYERDDPGVLYVQGDVLVDGSLVPDPGAEQRHAELAEMKRINHSSGGRFDKDC
ncbi:uncharacterized protein METZ01_LOCUS253834 [marine metagenome]|uniref:Uncharacterized protein n=1 Tax=marine metagenome TaxID=408172 RepID=A0A382IMU6_9ZZZZ